MLAGSLPSRRIIRQALRSAVCLLGYGSPAIFKWIKKGGIGSMSLFIQRIGDIISVAAAKISVSAPHANRA